MRLKLVYSLSDPDSNFADIALPLSFAEGGRVFDAIPPISEGSVLATVCGPVDPANIRVVQGKPPLDGSPPPRGLSMPELISLAEWASDVVGVISFIADRRFWLAHRLFLDQVNPETPADDVILNGLGTTEIYHSTRVILHGTTFSLPSPCPPTVIGSLLTKRSGIHIYAEALALSRPVAKFRELWRVLESAFGVQDDDLVARLAEYVPSIQLRFDEAELKELLVLRGKASHAITRAGLPELRRVGAETEEKVGRLKCLVERVLLTKKNWRSRDLAVEELTELRAFVGP